MKASGEWRAFGAGRRHRVGSVRVGGTEERARVESVARYPKITRKELAHNRKTTKRCIGLGIFKNLVDDSDHNATQTSNRHDPGNLGRIDV